MRRLLLWDIDGTLLTFNGVSRIAFDAAMSQAAEREVDGSLVSFAGKTDPQIAEETFVNMGIPAEEIPTLVRRSMRLLGPEMAKIRDELRLQGQVLPGVRELLGAIQEVAVVNTVLTGNLAVNAVLKLDLFRLTNYFDLEVGGFGSDSKIRPELATIAIDRVETMRNIWFGEEDIWVIGDSPSDAEVAKTHGLHCLLVATGVFGFDELQELGVDMVMRDLSDTNAVMELLVGES